MSDKQRYYALWTETANLVNKYNLLASSYETIILRLLLNQYLTDTFIVGVDSNVTKQIFYFKLQNVFPNMNLQIELPTQLNMNQQIDLSQYDVNYLQYVSTLGELIIPLTGDYQEVNILNNPYFIRGNNSSSNIIIRYNVPGTSYFLLQQIVDYAMKNNITLIVPFVNLLMREEIDILERLSTVKYETMIIEGITLENIPVYYSSVVEQPPVPEIIEKEETISYSEVFPRNQLLRYLKKQNQQVLSFSKEEYEVVSKTPILKFMKYIEGRQPTLPYHRHNQEMKAEVHWGQRKLLMAMVLFLSECLGRGINCKKVIYIGAASGQNINLLSELFPEHKFFLWDPAEFDSSLSKNKNITMYNELFTDETIDMVKGEPCLFISDIRSREKSSQENEEQFFKGKEDDMELQVRIIRRLQPLACSLKLSPSYEEGKSSYPSGDIIYQCWAPKSSTETRLLCFISDNPEYISESTLDNKTYESTFFYQNNVIRYAEIETNVLAEAAVDYVRNTYDLWHEVQVWNMYFNNYKLTGNKQYRFEQTNRDKLIAEVINRTTRFFERSFLDQFNIKNVKH